MPSPIAVAYLGGAGTRAASLSQIFSFPCSFRQKLCQIIGYRTPVGLALPLWEILDHHYNGVATLLFGHILPNYA